MRAILPIAMIVFAVVVVTCGINHSEASLKDNLKQEVPAESRYRIDEVQSTNEAALFVSDRKTNATISIYNGNSGLFIALYGPKKKLSSYPQLAISADGIQIIGKDGKPKLISLDELGKLDTE